MEDKALNRLLKKLSAVRATLNQDERDLLDGIIASARFGAERVEAEVTPHGLEMKNVDKIEKAEVRAHGLEMKNVDKIEKAEVVVHGLEMKNVDKIEKAEVRLHALEMRIADKVEKAEVSAHGVEMKSVNKTELGPDARIFRITLDKESVTYRVV